MSDTTADQSGSTEKNVLWFSEVGMGDVGEVGGKNASLGEMVSNLADLGVSVPDGFATTSSAFLRFLAVDGLDERIVERMRDLDVDDTRALAAAGSEIRGWITGHPFPDDLEAAIREAYSTLSGNSSGATFAVRSSATAEDLPDASFAGQQETFLNVTGVDAVLECVREVYASLYNDRAISYRVHHGFEHADVGISAGVQKMVRSDIGSSGVMFTVDTESGFDQAVFITSAYGLGEGVVQGAVNPDEFYVYKPALAEGKQAVLKRTVGAKATKMIYTDRTETGQTTEFVEVDPADSRLLSLTDEEVTELAKHAVTIEEHYGRPMDIEWGKDGDDGRLYILQARPETVQSRVGGVMERFKIDRGVTADAEVVIEGRAIGQKIGAGTVRVLGSVEEMHDFTPGDVLVADMTDPDWEPIMKRAAAIVTNRGGRTCHAAIIARELGIPAVVGSGSATTDLADGREVTVSCAEGDTGFVYDGILDFAVEKTELDAMPDVPVKVMMNVGTPDQAFSFSRLPNAGVGLMRLEFIINRQIGIHPKALLELEAGGEDLPAALREEVTDLIAAYDGPRDFFVKRVAEGIAMIAAAFSPEPVIVRMSDFKSNEYANLVGGTRYEPDEENPMIGYRGASRYLSDDFAECFAMECAAIRHVREEMGLTNVKVMIPFVRTIAEAEGVISLLGEHGLERGKDELQVVMMCEVPSNAIIPEQFLEHFDGFSIGSNDLTQLTLGVDRDSSLVAQTFNERDPAVLFMLERAIAACKKLDKYVGICGQGPSDDPELAVWLLKQGIESMSLNPDTVVETWLALAKVDLDA
ncbi:phosphoenolpyruvate synthase [Nocardioidaceae bacterium]|nr:phosphoenolpyruvate synthase [Nocardioidaceae bacterium]